jgi:hypothetical protein
MVLTTIQVDCPLPQKKSFTPPVITVPEGIREEVTKPEPSQIAHRFHSHFLFSFYFSKLNYRYHKQTRSQKNESLKN